MENVWQILQVLRRVEGYNLSFRELSSAQPRLARPFCLFLTTCQDGYANAVAD